MTRSASCPSAAPSPLNDPGVPAVGTGETFELARRPGFVVQVVCWSADRRQAFVRRWHGRGRASAWWVATIDLVPCRKGAAPKGGLAR